MRDEGKTVLHGKASIVSHRMSGLNCSEHRKGERQAVMAASIIGDGVDCAGASAQWAAYGLGRAYHFDRG